MYWAVEAYWRSGAWCWHWWYWIDRTVKTHWRSRANGLHNPSWLDGDSSPAHAGHRHRTHWAVQTYGRHCAQRLRRISWPEETHWLSGEQGWHHLPWLNPHPSLADAGSWDVAHRAKHAYWGHRTLNRIRRCLTSTKPSLSTVTTGSWRRSPTWLCHTPRVQMGFQLPASSRAGVLLLQTAASPLWLSPALPWGGDITPAASRVLLHPVSPPKSK
jgi:hypothetical protein